MHKSQQKQFREAKKVRVPNMSERINAVIYYDGEVCHTENGVIFFVGEYGATGF